MLPHHFESAATRLLGQLAALEKIHGVLSIATPADAQQERVRTVVEFLEKHILAKPLLPVAITAVARIDPFVRAVIETRRTAGGSALRNGDGLLGLAGPQLTPRELEVLRLIAEGQPNKQVAADLGISIKTVEKHRQHVMEKLNIHGTAGLTRYAVAHRLVDSGSRVPFFVGEHKQSA
ncbi:MAG TPA: LuxR C-terminal-related transcriptional regulator [Opitutaceae bacterium]|nr:LuxR C-terminal-related transcriptional regulator [Opitutaceae bacterium]